jgi:hypothetical protein
MVKERPIPPSGKIIIEGLQTDKYYIYFLIFLNIVYIILIMFALLILLYPYFIKLLKYIGGFL